MRDDALVNAKAKAALSFGLVPIVCIGEGLDVRREGNHVATRLGQLDASLAGIPAEKVAGLVIAYEPVWAIGTGEVATPEDAQEVCAAIRERISAGHGDEAARHHAYPVWRISKVGQHRTDHGAGRCRRRLGRGGELGCCRVREDLPVPGIRSMNLHRGLADLRRVFVVPCLAGAWVVWPGVRGRTWRSPVA